MNLAAFPAKEGVGRQWPFELDADVQTPRNGRVWPGLMMEFWRISFHARRVTLRATKLRGL